MLPKLTKMHNEAGPFGKVILGFLLLGVIILDVFVGGVIVYALWAFIPTLFEFELPDFLAYIILYPWLVVPLLVDCFWGEIKNYLLKKAKKRRKSKRKTSLGDIFSGIRENVSEWCNSNLGTTPHLGRYISRRERIKVIRSQKFHPYRENVDYIKVSENDKWVRIFWEYYPLDLICGYDKKNNELYFIDGYVKKLPGWASLYDREIDAFFEQRGFNYDNLPSVSKKSFDKIVANGIKEFEKVDWARLRYEWESEIAKDTYIRKTKKAYANIYKPVKAGKLNREFFTRTLSLRELQLTADAFRSGDIPVERIIGFNEYVNEYCVCNGVKVLGELKYPENEIGLDFLFDCLKDVDEAYFMPAIDVLSQVPVSKLSPIIEERAGDAYKRGDVVRLAGILYLAKNISYEIEFVRELKQTIQAQEDVGMTVVDENGITRFAPEQSEQFMKKEAVAFKPAP